MTKSKVSLVIENIIKNEFAPSKKGANSFVFEQDDNRIILFDLGNNKWKIEISNENKTYEIIDPENCIKKYIQKNCYTIEN